MENDALRRLVAAHPGLFRGVNPGQHLPAGWYQIVDGLCSEIELILGDELDAIQVHEIKAKFASLRFYFALDVAEPPGDPMPATVTPHVGGYVVAAQSRHPMRQAIDEAIALAGIASEKTCAVCGAPGEQMVAGALVYVACRTHRQPGSITASEYLRRRDAKRTRKGDEDAD
jgi:hypothetical protein